MYFSVCLDSPGPAIKGVGEMMRIVLEMHSHTPGGRWFFRISTLRREGPFSTSDDIRNNRRKLLCDDHPKTYKLVDG